MCYFTNFELSAAGLFSSMDKNECSSDQILIFGTLKITGLSFLPYSFSILVFSTWRFTNLRIKWLNEITSSIHCDAQKVNKR